MATQITIELDYRELYNAQLIAEMTKQSIEEVIVTKIKLFNPLLLYKADEPYFDVLERCTDVELWWLVTQTYPDKWRKRSNYLIQKSKQASLTEDEQIEHERLLEEYNLRVLLRSRMLVMLKERDYDVHWYFDRQLYD